MTKKNLASQVNHRDVDVLADEIAPWWNKNYTTIGKKQVATWKGALALMFVAGVAAALIWSAKTDNFDASKAATTTPASTLYYNPATIVTINGSNFTVNPTINTGGNAVSIVSLKMTFDKTKLTLTNIAVPAYSASTPFYNSETAGFDPTGSLTTFIANANSTGNINFDLSVGTSHSSATGIFSLATLTFSATSVGSTQLAYAASSGAGADGVSVNAVTGTTAAAITINAPDTTAPTFTKADDVSASFVTTDTINVTATDPSGVASTYYGFSNNNICDSSDTINTAFTNGANFTITGDHTDYLCIKAIDSAPTPNTGYFLVGQLHTDNSAPASGTFTINSNAAYTNSTAATLNITCPTDQWATVQMAYGTTASPTNWTNCAASQALTLAAGDGTKTVYVRFRDGGSNTTADITKTITMDTAAPASGTFTINSNAVYTNSTAATLNITCPTDQWATVQMAYGTTAAPTNWTNCAASQALTLAAGDGTKTVYVRFRDGGSNTTADITKTITMDTAAPASGSLAIPTGTAFLHSIILTANDGTDAASNIDTASRILQRRSTPITTGICGSYGSWSSISLVGTFPSFFDTNVITGNCYQYQYLVKDNAGNQSTFTASNTAKIAYKSDLNLEGQVNYLDYGILHSNYDNTTCGNVADITGPDANNLCIVDYLDYGVMHSEYGNSLL